MQDTQSSAIRTAINTGKVLTPEDLEEIRRSPNKMKRNSPTRLSRTLKSPVKKTTDDSTAFLL